MWECGKHNFNYSALMLSLGAPRIKSGSRKLGAVIMRNNLSRRISIDGKAREEQIVEEDIEDQRFPAEQNLVGCLYEVEMIEL